MPYPVFRISLAALLISCGTRLARAVPPGSTGWSKVFQDNFSGTKLDTSLWSKNYAQAPYNYLDHQAYESPDQVKESGGNLYITAIHQHNPAAPNSYVSHGKTLPLDYTSGAVNTKGKFSISGQQHDAYVEARMQLPSSIGSWPAFWLLPENGGWPPEIDALELPISSATGRDRVQYHYHYGSSRNPQQVGDVYDGNVNYTQGYHTFGVEWGGDHMSWYVDDQRIATINNPNIEQAENMYIILNLGVGGWAGTPPSSAVYPEKMRIDWVRAYQLNDTASSYSTQSIDTGHGATNAFHGLNAVGPSAIPSAVPEPSSIAAIVAAVGTTALRRRRS